MKALKVFCALLILCSVQLAQANETETLSCSDRTQLPPEGVNVAMLTVGTGMILKTSKIINSQDGSAIIPAGVTLDLNDRKAFDAFGSGCFDGTELTVVEDNSKGDAIRLKINVLCDRHPNFQVYTFSLQCDY